MTQAHSQSLKKHVGAIHVSGKLSLLKRKIANVLLFNAYNDLPHADEHSINIQDLADIAGFNSKDFELLKNAFRNLAKTTVEWNILSDDGTEDWTVSTLLSRATIRKGRGVCLYAYDRELRKKLYHPEMYARINLTIQRKFKSGYALVLYENCARFRRIRSTGWIDVKSWRKLFGIDPEQYEFFKDFSKRVLKPAIAEVNRESDIQVKADFRRENRKVSKIRFSVIDNPMLGVDEFGEHKTATLLERLIRVGVTKGIAAKLLIEYEEERIGRNLEYVEKELRAGKPIKNVGGYTTRAIQDDYGLAAAEQIHAKRAEQEKENRERSERVNTDRAREDGERLQRELLESQFDRLSDNEQQALIDETLANFDSNDYLVRDYRKKGLGSILFRQAVMAVLTHKTDQADPELEPPPNPISVDHLL